MRIAIVGGTGTVGKHIASELAARGHEVRVLSRSSPEFPVDLTSGEGLAAALAGCDVAVDASRTPSSSSKRAAQIHVDGSRILLAAEQADGIGHHVCISIVGCDLVPFGYYKVKTEQEHIVEQGPVPYSIVRATQFHELMTGVLAVAGKYHVLPAPTIQLQTVAAKEVASAVADVATGQPVQGIVEVAGPQTLLASDVARTWKSVTGTAAVIVPFPIPGKFGRGLRDGVLTTDKPDIRGTITFAEWLAEQQATRT